MDEVEKVNEEFKAYNSAISPGNQSRANESKINTPEEDKKLGMAEQIIGDLQNQRTDIDGLKSGLAQLVEMVNQQTKALNNIAQAIQAPPQNLPQQQPGESKINLEALSTLGDVAEKLIGAYKNLKGNDIAPQLIDQQMINEKMRTSFLDNLETGEAITNFIKTSLKKNVTRQIINTSLKDIGKDDHAPQ